MKKLIIILICIFSWGLEIDITSLEKQLQNNPDDLQNRLVVASYYVEHKKYDKAQKYLNEVLKKDPNNKYAKKLKNKINSLYFYDEFINKHDDINKGVDELYEKGKYKDLLKLYKTLKSLNKTDELNESSKLKIARVAMWEGKYDLSLEILQHVKNKKSLDFYEIKAYDLYYKGDYKNAKRYFQTLYQTTGKTEYAQKLLDIYFYLGEIDSAQKLILSLKRTHPKTAEKYEKRIKQIKEKRLNELKKRYEKNPNFENLQALAYLEFQHSPDKAIKLVKDYIKKHPNDKKAKIFLAKLLSWSGKNDEALKYLSEFQNTNDMSAKLLFGKILAWQGEYDKAALFLSDVYEHGNPQQKYEAKKMLGYIALWQGKDEKAKQIFSSILKQNPQDEEAKEALMVLNKNVKPLIAKYEKLLKKDPNNEEYILKLADYNYMIKNYEKSAYYYEKYLKMHPEKIEVYKTLGDIYLQLKNYYKGFGNLEYYANNKNTKEAYLELAKRYYWNGFNKEALKVLDDLLKKYPNYQDALILKAKILKVNPRFVNSSSAATIDEYYAKRSEKILALGDRAYFAGLYKSANDYYKEYLFLKPNDYDVREKYAYSLEQSKQHDKAAGEYYLLMWYKKTPAIEYHYAYNLQKSGKLDEAEKIYKELLNNVPKPLPEFLNKFLEKWKKAWESLDFEKYASFYDKSISDKLYWRLKKQAIFQKASYISVGIYDPILLSEKDGIYKVRFYQVYASKPKKDKGYKTLEIKCENNESCKIIKESWEPGNYTPYNQNNSLEKYIRQNLEIIKQQKEKKKKVILKEKVAVKKNPKFKDIKKEDIVLPNLKTKLKKEETALDLLKMKEKQATQNSVIPHDLKKVSQNFYNWKIFGYINYFEDNQNTKMWTKYIMLSHRIDSTDFYPFIFYRDYNLKQTSNKNGFYYGIGIKKSPFLFDVFIDKSGKETYGWDFEYSNILPGITFKLNKHNMVYSRRSVCSTEHTRIKAELTGYKLIKDPRSLWWSLAYEKVDDENQVITPQLEYDIKTYTYKNTPVVLYFSGWYQFNSKPTKCYYSPEKTDTNIIGVKVYKTIQPFNIMIKPGIGYSFWDETYVYKIKLKADYINEKNIILNGWCEYSNTSALAKNTDYRSFECQINAGKVW